MSVARARMQEPLLRRLLPLAYGLGVVIALILGLTWGALQVQVTLAGFLNGESVWSKAQKQAVVDLDAYAVSNNPADLSDFKRNYALLESDRWARDAVRADDYDRQKVTEAFTRGDVMPDAKSGMIFMLRHFSGAPYIKDALQAWRSTDVPLGALGKIAEELQHSRSEGRLSTGEIARQRSRIHALNRAIDPLSNQFSLSIAHGASWVGRVLFVSVLAAACIASLLWLMMARRVLAGIRRTEEDRRIAAEAMASIAEGVIIANPQRQVTSSNAAHYRITGYSTRAMQGMRFDETRSLPDGSPLPQAIWDAIDHGENWLGEVSSRRQDGSSYPETLSISAIRDGEGRVQRYVAVVTDITGSKADQRRLEHMATHDVLTGLANRSEFERGCAEMITAATREREAVAIMFIDLDAFKVVNDSYSHAVGDDLLVEVAERIRRELGEDAIVGRIGGDEFTAAIGRLSAREEVTGMVHRLLIALARPVAIGDNEVVLGASIGIAGYPLDGGDPATLIANADAAMYAAKTEERNTFRFYTPMMQADARDRLELAGELRQALERNEFSIVYQPSVEMRSGRIVAAEALLRWTHPQRGEIPPDHFIPMAEELGLIRSIDAWVLQSVCSQVQAWDAARMPELRIAVNVSASSFSHPSFVTDVSRALHSRRISPQRMVLEITEGAMLRLGDATERTLHALHDLGVGAAIDDFGTGYSSLAYLKLPAVTCLKIDRSFVNGLPGNSNDVAIIEAILALSESMGLRTIAEGIETEAQHEFLLRAGCAEAQGYLYARPLGVAEIERLLRPNAVHSPTKLKLVPPVRSA